MIKSVAFYATMENAFPKSGCVTVKGTVMLQKMKKTVMGEAKGVPRVRVWDIVANRHPPDVFATINATCWETVAMTFVPHVRNS